MKEVILKMEVPQTEVRHRRYGPILVSWALHDSQFYRWWLSLAVSRFVVSVGWTRKNQ